MIENEIIKKSNALINARCKLNIYEQKILYKVISQIHIKDKDFKDYEVRTSDLIDFLGTNNNSVYDEIKQCTYNLLKHVLVIEKEDFIIQTNWFSSVKYIKKGKILFRFTPELKPYLLNLKESFTRFALENIRNFKSKHSPKVYEILKQYEKIGFRVINIEDLRKILVLEGAYKNYNDFKKYVLLVVQEEINKYSDISFEFREIKDGRRVIEIEFYIKSKKVDLSRVIDLPIEGKKCINSSKQLDVTDLSNEKINNLKAKIEKIINDAVREKKLIEWIRSGKESDIDFYLDNWSKWDYKTKATKAGFFIDLVDNKRPLPSGEKGIRVNLDKPPQALNYEQRQYSDEYFNSLYDNVEFVKDNKDNKDNE